MQQWPADANWRIERGVDWDTKDILDANSDTSVSARSRAPSIESVNGRLRDELLNERCSHSPPHIRATLTTWQAHYKVNRPQSGLGWLTPNEYADTVNPLRETTLHSMISSAPALVAQPGQIG